METIQTRNEASKNRTVRSADSTYHGDVVHQSSTNRRALLCAIGGVAALGVGAGCLGDMGPNSDDNGDYPDSFDENGDPEYGEWFGNVDTYQGTVNARDESNVVVAVGANGGLAFDPAAILIKPGTTVIWEWTGDGGQHDVAHVDGGFESELTGDAGHTFEHTFDEAGIYRYVCNPHQQAGMKGAIAVQDGETEESESVRSAGEGR